MRWPMLLLITATASMAATVAPLPEIETGTHPQPIEIWENSSHPSLISGSAAFLVGEVDEVSSEVQTTPQQTLMSETCDVHVESAFGHLAQIQGIKMARLKASQEGSPYVPVDPEWGHLRHLTKGQKILVLLHDDKGPSFGSEALIKLTDATRKLPAILRRTAFTPSEFTDQDLKVVQAASLPLHDRLAEERTIWREVHEKEMPENNLTTYALTALASVAGVLVCFRLMRQMKKRALRQSAP